MRDERDEEEEGNIQKQAARAHRETYLHTSKKGKVVRCCYIKVEFG
jgi:hypothetical protein